MEYGETVSSDYPSFISIKSGYYTFSHTWEVDKIKKINIGMGSYKSKYYTVLKMVHKLKEDERVSKIIKKESKQLENASTLF